MISTSQLNYDDFGPRSPTQDFIPKKQLFDALLRLYVKKLHKKK